MLDNHAPFLHPPVMPWSFHCRLLKMTAESMKREIEAITECPVCISSFTDPRILPCVHTNCYKCIKKWCKDKRNGDKTACPVCRRDFVIPTGGIEELPKNFYLTHLLSIIDLGLPDDSREIHHCDLCSSDENVSAVKSATMLCLDCQQKLCASCHSRHSKSKQFQTHKTVSIREKVAKHELCHKLPPYYCEKHRDESLKMYCFDSKTVSCMICYREQHHNHKCSEVSNLSDEFRRSGALHWMSGQAYRWK